MKSKVFAMSCLILMTLMVRAQEQPRPVVKPVQFFIGIQPGILPTFVDQWGQTVWDINILPITVEYAIDRHWAVRVHSIYNLAVGAYNQAAVISNMGIEIVAPFYLSLKNSEEGHRGFFIGPAITPGYNKLNHYYTLGVGAEAGFAFLFGNKWSVNVSAQAGIKFQKFPEESFIRRVPYSIPVVALGIWL